MEFLMEFGLRDWLLVLGPVFIIGVLVHGYWRMRSNRNSLKMSLDKSFLTSRHERAYDADDPDPYRAELPNGGARVVSKPQQKTLDLEEDVPVLMEPVADAEDFAAFDADQADEEPIYPDPVSAPVPTPAPATKTKSAAAVPSATAAVARKNAPPEPAPELEPEPAPVQASVKAQPRASADCPEKYLVLYVSARHKDFDGGALLACLEEQRMTFGEMSIFHRLGADGQSLFSLVNAVEPGTFEPARMHDLSTPAISLFMRAHELSRPVAVYHQMLAVAEALASSLGGEVRDQARKPLTRPAMERYQQDLQDFVDTYFH